MSLAAFAPTAPMPLPPPPSDTDATLRDKPDTSADARVRAHMIGAPGNPAASREPALTRLGRWLRLLLRR